tara:strand:+ start:2302 stop:2547 length:246 start_codon:yes stop_codon:yes gene_type:complete
MALFNLNLNTSILQKYKTLIQNIYMITVILLIFHLLINLSKKSNTGLIGDLFNCDLINTLCILLISYSSYELVFKELISIN